MKLESARVEEHADKIHTTIHRAMHTGDRDKVGLALLSVAHSFAIYVAPENDHETQLCLAFELVADVLDDLQGEPEMVSFLQYMEEKKGGVTTCQ